MVKKSANIKNNEEKKGLRENLKSMDSKTIVKNASIIMIIVIATEVVATYATNGPIGVQNIMRILAMVLSLIVALTGSQLPVSRQRMGLYIMAGILAIISFGPVAIVIGIFYIYSGYRVKGEIEELEN
ncbi:MAG: hypothetical protein ACI37V_00495 [Methanobrevibacter sp.]